MVGRIAPVRPAAAPVPSIEDQVAALVATYDIGDNTVSTNDAGMTVLTGTVPDSISRARIQQHVESNAIPIRLNLRTGEDVAADVFDEDDDFVFAADAQPADNNTAAASASAAMAFNVDLIFSFIR